MFHQVVITIDMGASKTKAIAQEYPEGKPVVLLFDSEVAGTYPTILKIPTSFRKMYLETLIFRFQFSISLSFIAQILLVG